MRRGGPQRASRAACRLRDASDNEPAPAQEVLFLKKKETKVRFAVDALQLNFFLRKSASSAM
jgi:hypothetical protein